MCYFYSFLQLLLPTFQNISNCNRVNKVIQNFFFKRIKCYELRKILKTNKMEYIAVKICYPSDFFVCSQLSTHTAVQFEKINI